MNGASDAKVLFSFRFSQRALCLVSNAEPNARLRARATPIYVQGEPTDSAHALHSIVVESRLGHSTSQAFPNET